MSDRRSPPTWTEWTRNPSERSPQRKAFDDILGELRKEGLIEVKGSLFVQLARYSFLQVKDATIDVQAFLRAVPDAVFGQVPPAYRTAEVNAVFQILRAAGLCTVTVEGEAGPVEVVLTERQSAGEVARNQLAGTLLSYLRDTYARWDPTTLVLKASSFPTPDSVCAATKVDPSTFSVGQFCVFLEDRPEANESTQSPFVQETLDGATAPVALLQFWALPDPKNPGGSSDPEFSLVIPTGMTLSGLVRDKCVPLLVEFFRCNEHHDLATEVQAKYATYMHKYRERFASAAGIVVTDRIDKVLGTTDPEGEAFANAVYVLAQVLKATLKEKVSAVRSSANPIVYQAARIAYARAMALRVRKRKAEREAATRVQDSALLVGRLKDSVRPLTLDELKKTPDATKNREIGSKYATLIDLLPLVPLKEGDRPPVFELDGRFFHRESLLRVFFELREREALAQRDRLAQDWAKSGIPAVEELFLFERELSSDFLKALELVYQERILAMNTADFIKDYLPTERDLLMLARWIWPEGHRGAITPLEVVTRGLDPILYEDKDRLRRKTLVGVLNLAAAYPSIVKEAWNIVFLEDGLFRFVIRKLMAFFGGKLPRRRPKEAPATKASSSGPSTPSSAGKPTSTGAKEVQYRQLVSMAPALADRATLSNDREKLAAQWCLKFDKNAGRKTLEVVDDEIARLALKVKPELYSEANSAKVALFLVERSSVLAQVTSSRAYHRYLYLTALQAMAEHLGK